MKSGWVTKKLGEVCEILDSRRIPITRKDRKPGNIPYYGATGQVDSVADYIFDERLLLLGEDGADWSAGANSAYIIEGKSWVNNHAHVLRPLDIVSDCWLMYYLNATDLNRWVSGTTVPKLNQGNMCEIPIPIPPLAEQKRIVAKIDAAFEKIDALKANAEKNLANAKELFQSALDEAMRPKKGWVEKRLGEIGSVCMCKRILKSETNTERGVPFYKIGTFGKTANAYISQETFDRYRKLYKFPRKGEILISAAGTIGRAVTYDGAPAYFQDSNIVWVANDEKEVLNQYLKWFYATSPWHVTKGATIQRLYNDNIESAQIAYPDICTQKQICQTLEISSQKTETLQQNYARQIAGCAEMRQSILREAFEGRI